MKRDARGRWPKTGRKRRPTKAQPSPGPQEHRTRTIRSLYKVEKLPEDIQLLVYDAYARGDPFWKIAEELKQRGHYISARAVGRYWNSIWSTEHERLRQARANFALLKRALRLDPNSTNGQIAEELLYTMVFTKMPLIRKEQPLPLLREAREQKKASGKEGKPAPKAADANPVKQGRAIRRRWRELYGLDAQDENEEGEDEEK